jgi:glycosyltransferase involved in cell wall biosynthesis
MKIAIDARELHGKPTGVGRFLGELLAAWKTMPEGQGHEFVLLAPEGATSDGGTLWEQMALPTLARDAGAGVLFAPAYSGPVLPPVPMVLAIHDVSFAAHPEWFAWREGARRRTAVRLAARAATRVITISQFSKREIVAHLGIESEKITVVYPGVPPSPVGRALMARHDSANREGLRHAASEHTVLFVGSIFNRRHVPELIDGFARLARIHPELRLEIVGDNRTSPHVDLEAIIRSTVLGDHVHIRSYVPDDQLRALYGNSAAFVFLSEYEGFGLTPLEALASGLPVLLLDTPVAREICGDAALYVARPDPALIERALATLLFDAAERERILDEGRRVLARYSWTDCARRVLEVLVEAGSPGPTGFAAR